MIKDVMRTTNPSMLAGLNTVTLAVSIVSRNLNRGTVGNCMIGIVGIARGDTTLSTGTCRQTEGQVRSIFNLQT